MVKVIYETDPISSTLIMHTANQKKKKKYINSYVHAIKKKTKSQSTNHLNFSSHMILILSMQYIYLFIISRLRDFFVFLFFSIFLTKTVCFVFPSTFFSTPLHSYSPHKFTNHFQFMCVIHSTNNYT